MADVPQAAAPAASSNPHATSALGQQQTIQHNPANQRQMAQARLQLEQKLDAFWNEQMTEVQLASDFKNHLLPLARIKKIMKSDEDVRMISAEAPVLFAKACEMFILELTYRAWAQTEDAKRRTLQRSDIAAAIQKTDIFDFLIDIVPREDPKKDDPRVTVPGAALAAPPVDSQVQHFYQIPVPGPNPFGVPQPQTQAAAPTPGDPDTSAASLMYAQNPQQLYGNPYANIAYQQAMNPQFMHMQQQMMFGGAPVGSYPAAQYLTTPGTQPGTGLPAGMVPGQPGIPQPQGSSTSPAGAEFKSGPRSDQP